MYQVDWQENREVEEYNSKQFSLLDAALDFYNYLISKGNCWVKLSNELMEYSASVSENKLQDAPIHCGKSMVTNHYVDEEVGRVFGYTCMECGESIWDA